jgi:predicted MPP superfamily phosphohydrolase
LGGISAITGTIGVRHTRKRMRLTRAITRPPFYDETGGKGWLQSFARAQPHAVRHVRLEIPQWPLWPRPLRVAFLSDFHTGSHTNDVARLHALMEEVCAHHPDVVLFGGDYVNLQWIGGGRVPPYTIAAALGRAHAPLGRFAILGNHDCSYDASAVARALSAHGIRVLDHECRSIEFENAKINILGIPDEYRGEPKAFWLLKSMRQEVTIVLAHDPAWFRYLPSGPFIMLAGHTHGGQIRFPVIGVIRNASKAPLRWSYGLIQEKGQYLYVTSGIGTSGIPLRWRAPPEIVVLDLNGPSHRDDRHKEEIVFG